MKKMIALLCVVVLAATAVIGVTSVRSSNKIKGLNDDVAALQKAAEADQQTIKTLTGEAADAAAQIEALTKETADKGTELEALAGQLTAAEETGAEKAAEIETLTAQVEALTADAEAKAAEIETLTADAEAKAAQIEALTQEAADKAAELEALTAQLAAAEESGAEKAAEIEKLTAQLETVNAELTEANEKLQQISETLSRKPADVQQEERVWQVGDKANGFVVTDVRSFALLNADIVLFEHEKTGALVMLMANEDTNRVFEITFRTPAETNMGVSHVFEHSTLSGSEKYPSRDLFFNLSYQTYNTYMNASTYNMMTTYPVASLSEAQLLKYADFYTDSCFHPVLLHDESIFREEAWRYVMETAEDDLTLAGTVYSEMQGSYTLQSAAGFNFEGTLFPGSTIGNSHGGLPTEIPNMTHADVTEYHAKYYHPSNSLTCLYGKFTDAEAFLELLDGYFSEFEKKEFVIEDANYEPIKEGVTASFEYGVETGSDTTNGSMLYYGFVCGEKDEDTMNRLDLLTTLLGSDGSAVMQNLKTALPAATCGCYVEITAPELAVVFYANGVNAEDAELFRKTVDDSLAQIAEEGFDRNEVDALIAATKLDILLIGESSSIGVSMIPNVVYYWASTGDVYGYMDFINVLDQFEENAANGVYEEALRSYLIGNTRTALVITNPVPGLKEEQDAALAQKLAEIKAGLTDEEIAKIVADTAAYANREEEETTEFIAQLQAVTVDTLPEEARIYEVNDTVNAEGNRVVNALADADGVGETLLMLDASGIPQDQVHYFKLFVQLIGELDTSAHTRGELSSLITRYLYDANIRVSVFDNADDNTYKPYLRVSFFALDEDMTKAYELVRELLFDGNLDDVQRVKDTVTSLKTGLKSSITSSPYYVPLYRAYAACKDSYSYYNYVTYLDYYAFLVEVEQQLENDPDAVIASLKAIRDYFDNSTGAVIGFSGSAESAANHQAAAEAFLAGLNKKEIEAQTYSFPKADRSEALVIDSAVNYNMVFASYEEMEMEGYTGALDAITSLVNDSFLLPLLRSQYGAYSVLHGASEDGVYIITYRDPNVQETFGVYGQVPELVAGLSELDQETLDGYILSAYAYYAQSSGEISGGMSAVLNTLECEKQEKVLQYMRELKGITADTVAQYADMYAKLAKNGMIATAGAASTVNANAELYNVVLNPFGVEDKSDSSLQDVNEGDWYYEVVRFAYENGMMQPVAEDRFGVTDDTSMGELCGVYCAMLGVANSPEESIALLAQYGVLTPDTTVDEKLTREDLIIMSYYFCALAGIEPGESTLGEYPDAAEADPELAGILAWMLENGLMAAHDGELKLAENANRADAAQLLVTLYNILF